MFLKFPAIFLPIILIALISFFTADAPSQNVVVQQIDC